MIDPQKKRQLAMFAKYWQPGQVKSRLGLEIGHDVASQLYLKFVQTLLVRLSAAGDERQLVFTPKSRRAEFQRICDGTPWRLSHQAEGDLGHRMSDFFARSLASDHDRVVLIGSDSPTLPTRLIEQSFSALERCDIVLGPSRDGGYYLVGMKNHLPAMFSGIDWSTDRVLEQTLDRIAIAYPDAQVRLLEAWFDVDTLGDVRRLHAELLGEESASSSLKELRELCDSVVA